MDIEDKKVDIEKPKVDIESVLLESGADFSVKTRVHIHRMFEKFGFDEIFGRSAVMELLELKASGASKFLSNLVRHQWRRRHLPSAWPMQSMWLSVIILESQPATRWKISWKA